MRPIKNLSLSLYIYICVIICIYVPRSGSHPTPPAMVVVITHQPPLPPVAWVGPVGMAGAIQPPTNSSNATGMKQVDVRQDKIGPCMPAEILEENLSLDQIRKTRSNKLCKGKINRLKT